MAKWYKKWRGFLFQQSYCNCKFCFTCKKQSSSLLPPPKASMPSLNWSVRAFETSSTLWRLLSFMLDNPPSILCLTLDAVSWNKYFIIFLLKLLFESGDLKSCLMIIELMKHIVVVVVWWLKWNTITWDFGLVWWSLWNKLFLLLSSVYHKTLSHLWDFGLVEYYLHGLHRKKG